MALIPVPNTVSKDNDSMQIDEGNVDRSGVEYKNAFNNFLKKLDNHPAKILKEYLEQLDNLVNYDPKNFDALKILLEKIKELIENLDNAKIFVDIGGFNYIPKLLQSESVEIQEITCDLLAELVQNHKFCQDEAFKHGVIPLIIHLYNLSNYDQVKIKAFYALSSLLRGNQDMQNQFFSLNGMDFLLEALQSFVHKIRIKATLLVIYMCLENDQFKKEVHRKGIINQLLKNAMTYEHDLSHEHTLNALVTLAKTDPSCVDYLKENCQDLKSFLLERGAMLDGKPEFAEEDNYVKTLYEMCFESDLSEAVKNLNLPKL